MKLTLPVYCQSNCYNCNYADIQLMPSSTIVLQCADRTAAWEIYCKFGFITFDTDDITISKDSFFNKKYPTISKFEFQEKSVKEMREYFISLAEFFKDEQTD